MKKELSVVLAVVLMLTLLLTDVAFAHIGHKWVRNFWGSSQICNWLDMNYSCVGSCYCGPSSGGSIGQYYRTRPLEFYDNNYADLPEPLTMYRDLWRYMDVFGGFFYGYTDPPNYGPGFAEMALHYEYDNFSYVTYGFTEPVTEDDYWAIVDAIDHGWPVAVAAIGFRKGFEGVNAISTDEESETNHWPCKEWHWIAIKGYRYYRLGLTNLITWSHYINCTDSWSKANKLVLDWDQLVDVVGDDLRVVIIKDEDITDDFEWGNDGGNLSDGDNVDWNVTASGGAYVQIDGANHRPGTGTKSAKFYCDYTNSASAYYPCSLADYIGFYFKKDDNSWFHFDHGNYFRAIVVRITDAERIQYCNNTCHSVGDPISTDTWYLLEFKNIDWDAYTYDIYLNGSPLATGVNMWYSMNNNGLVRFGASSTTSGGSFWIDDVVDYGTVVDDFEWGDDADKLNKSEGEIDWNIASTTTSVVEIDTARKHTGTRSARIYYDGTSITVRAYYSLRKPSYIGFWLLKEDPAYAFIRNGDGSMRIDVRINSAKQVQYHNGTAYHTVYTLPYHNMWYHIEFKDIDWSPAYGTYDIYVDGVMRKDNALMRQSSDYNGEISYGTWTGSGAFWIDDISDSLR